MGYLLEKCKLVKLDGEILGFCHPFTCGDEDLDDFFQNDAMRYKRELLGKTYCFVLDENPKVIVCMFTLSNLFLFSSEQQEAENLGYDFTKTLHTRLMYYDLKKLISS